jgi:hypothetical protein
LERFDQFPPPRGAIRHCVQGGALFFHPEILAARAAVFLLSLLWTFSFRCPIEDPKDRRPVAVFFLPCKLVDEVPRKIQRDAVLLLVRGAALDGVLSVFACALPSFAGLFPRLRNSTTRLMCFVRCAN